jgi:eukaryotic-like serine/threonine-protein kinase
MAMDTERWRSIEELYHAALDCAPEARANLLGRSDAETRREVELLLAQRSGEGLLAGTLAEFLTPSISPLPLVEAQLGPYRIVRLIGVGGMGQVYEGQDSRLGRRVAIKVCTAEFASRFTREAQAISALNHPNICTLYDVGPNYLVMELVEGPTLAERIAKGPIPLEEALGIARQIAEALEYAHDKGIVHRDLKPANIKITPEGRVKVLDFGLAKAMDPPTSAAGSSPDDSPTVMMHETAIGIVLGTAAYMAPEQARGQAVDQRADIWAFGVVMWEMVTGWRLFAGQTHSDTLAAVLKTDPEWETAPSEWRRLLQACLAKDPRQRLRHIGDALRLVDDDGGRLNSMATARTGSSRTLWMLAAALTLLGVGVGSAWIALGTLRPSPSPLGSVEYQIPVPPGALRPNTGGAGFELALSRDGRKLAFIAKVSGTGYLWVQPLNSLTAQRLDHTEGARYPFWSPDDQAVAYFADGALKRIAVSGGTPQVVAQPAAPAEGQWSRFGVIVFRRGDDLWQVPAGGGVVSPAIPPLPKASGLRRELCGFLPDGKRIMYTEGASQVSAPTYVQALGASGREKIANKPGCYASGYLLSWEGPSIMAQRFDLARLKAEGEPLYVSNTNLSDMDVSENGVMALDSKPALGRLQLTWFDRTGKRLGTAAPPGGPFNNPALSPDGKRLLFNAEGNIHLLDLARGTDSRIVSHGGDPTWSPDGSRIAFNSALSTLLPGHGTEIFVKSAFGTGADENLLAIPGGNVFPMDWSPDGRWLAFTRTGNGGPFSIWLLSLKDRKPQPYVENADRPRFSPRGNWVAYDSPESGRNEVYVQPFPSTGKKWQISNNGGSEPQWRGDGRQLFYSSGDTPGRMMEVDIAEEQGGIKASVPRALFEIPWVENFPNRNNWLVTRDGQRFLGRVPVDPRDGRPDFVSRIIYNWPAALDERR